MINKGKLSKINFHMRCNRNIIILLINTRLKIDKMLRLFHQIRNLGQIALSRIIIRILQDIRSTFLNGPQLIKGSSLSTLTPNTKRTLRTRTNIKIEKVIKRTLVTRCQISSNNSFRTLCKTTQG
jgi:hypothetical protein